MRVGWTRRERDTTRRRAEEARRPASRCLVESATLEDGAVLVAPLTPEQVAQMDALSFQVRKSGRISINSCTGVNAAAYGTADPPTAEAIAANVREVCARIMRLLVEVSLVGRLGWSVKGSGPANAWSFPGPVS